MAVIQGQAQGESRLRARKGAGGSLKKEQHFLPLCFLAVGKCVHGQEPGFDGVPESGCQ